MTAGIGPIEKYVSEQKGIPTEQALLEQLRKQTLVVTFNKLDGDERVMTCTKSFDVIPEEHHPKTDKEPKAGTITVWDVNAEGWRSFRYDRITKIEENKMKDFSGNLITISVLEREIQYAESQLQPHDTGHIHTAISWMKHRVEMLKGV